MYDRLASETEVPGSRRKAFGRFSLSCDVRRGVSDGPLGPGHRFEGRTKPVPGWSSGSDKRTDLKARRKRCAGLEPFDTYRLTGSGTE